MELWSEKQTDCLIRKYNEGTNSNDIAYALGKSQKAVQNKIGRLRETGLIGGGKRENKPIDIHENALKLLQKDRSIDELSVSLNLTPRMLHGLIDDLNEEGYYIDEINGMFKLRKDIILEDNHFEDNWNGERIIRFGVTADKHMASKSQQLEHCNTLYDIFKSEGIKRVFDAGDLSDGYKMRPGQEHEVFVHGADDQEDYIVKNHPSRPGIITEFITGNHDASHVKSGGRDIGKGIAARRPDMKYLGMFNAKINLTPNCVLELNHPFDGASYALSYTLQKYLDSMSGGEKPNILINGHHHKAMYLFYRNVHAFEAGTLCGQTAWMRGKRIAAHVGGWIIEVHVNDEGTVTRCKGEFFPFYVMNEHDYGVI
jgi:biotin operon repressor/predicted phosphodiesterase